MCLGEKQFARIPAGHADGRGLDRPHWPWRRKNSARPECRLRVSRREGRCLSPRHWSRLKVRGRAKTKQQLSYGEPPECGIREAMLVPQEGAPAFQIAGTHNLKAVTPRSNQRSTRSIG